MSNPVCCPLALPPNLDVMFPETGFIKLIPKFAGVAFPAVYPVEPVDV